MSIALRHIAGLTVVAVFLIVGTGSGGRPTALWAAGAVAPKWMRADAAHKQVSFTVIAAQGGANGTLNFNGYANGQMTVTVPVGWRIHIDLVNSGAGALPHSLEVIKEVHPVSPQGIPPAIRNAQSDELLPGVAPGAKDAFDFTAMPAGKYLWFCGVPGHGLQGMWDYFIVSSMAKVPSVAVK